MYAVSAGSHNQNSLNIGLILFGLCQFIACLFIVNKFYTILDPQIDLKWMFIITVIFYIYMAPRANGHMSPGLQAVNAITDTAWKIATRVSPALHDRAKADTSQYVSHLNVI